MFMNKINRVMQKYNIQLGWQQMLLLPIYPVLLMTITPLQLIRSLWNSRVLLYSNHAHYFQFSPTSGLDWHFYKTQTLNLLKYGRLGKSPTVGLGNCQLTAYNHLCLFSSYLSSKFSCATLLLGMFGWLSAHLLWMVGKSDSLLDISVFLLVLSSTTFYSNTFSDQNYNVVGWAFFPIGLFGLYYGNWQLITLGWLLVSFGSPTATVIGLYLTVIHFFVCGDVELIYGIFPAAIKLFSHLLPSLVAGDVKRASLKVLKALGAIDRNTRYKRTTQKSFTITPTYYLVLYIQFGMAYVFLLGGIPHLFIAGTILFVINTRFVRFADTQSMQMMMMSLGTAEIFAAQSYVLLIPFYLMVSPLPIFTGLQRLTSNFFFMPVLSPFKVKAFMDGMSSFFEPVKKGDRVLMCFDDPEGVYEKIYDGFRGTIEPPLYLASKKEFLLMPDWYAVIETNYEGALDFWGRDVNSVLKNVRVWNTNYIVVYQEENDDVLDEQWERSGFKPLSEFKWKSFKGELKGAQVPLPNWWLLKPPADI